MITYPKQVILTNESYTANAAAQAQYSNNAISASYISINGTVKFSGIELVGGGATGSLGTNQTLNISSSQIVDSIPNNKGNSVKWFVFLEDGINSRANKVVASWNNATSSFYVTELKSTGNVPVNLSVQHFTSSISLVANPDTGSWGVRLIRILI